VKGTTVNPTTASSIACPECEARLQIPADSLLGQVLTCPDCHVELEITGLDPLALEPAPEVEEDWGE